MWPIDQLYIELGYFPNPFFFVLECNLPCLMTSDKDYLGEGNVDKFDALYFKLKQFAPDDQGENYLQGGILALCKFHYCHFSKLSWYLAYTGSPLIGRFLGPRKNCFNRKPSYWRSDTLLCEWPIESIGKCFFFVPALNLNKSAYIAGICFRM